VLNIFIELRWKVADIWTGGWFPLIPLAITNKDVKFTWIDSVWKKLKAVDEFILELWLTNVKTINARAEDLGKNLDYRENFDFITSRATAYFPTLLEYAIPLLKVGWIFIAYKLDDKEELKATKKALMKLWSKILKVKNYKISDQKRTLVFIEKLKTTHNKYPRKVWEPLKNPL
jgi:16S rRNA (guanine527-N7)-methyltransferase